MGEGRGAFYRRIGGAKGLGRGEDESWWCLVEETGTCFARMHTHGLDGSRLILVHRIQGLGNLGQSSV